MKSIYQTCIPRQAVLDGTADFVINLSDLPTINEAEADVAKAEAHVPEAWRKNSK